MLQIEEQLKQFRARLELTSKYSYTEFCSSSGLLSLLEEFLTGFSIDLMAIISSHRITILKVYMVSLEFNLIIRA